MDEKKVGIRRVTPGSNFEIESSVHSLNWRKFTLSAIFFIYNEPSHYGRKALPLALFWVPNSMYETQQLEEESSKESALL